MLLYGNLSFCFTIISVSVIFLAQVSSNLQSKKQEGKTIAIDVFYTFVNIYNSCLLSKSDDPRFADLKSFVNYPSRTTVGFAPKFTNNRKFFANMINTKEFKDMLARDMQELRSNHIKKMTFCDIVTMDFETLKLHYDREIDQTKI